MTDGTSGRTTKIWRDGQMVNWEDATIHVMSHVVQYGSNVFEGIRCYDTPAGPALFRLSEHIRRLHDSCTIYRMSLPYSIPALVQACVETVSANELRHCYLRPVVLRVGEEMGVYPLDVPLSVFIIAWKWGRYLGQEGVRNGVDICVSSWRRPAPDTFPGLAKAGGNYLNSQLSKIEARQNGFIEGVMLDVAGRIAEGSGENIFLVRDGVLYTPPLSAGILHGITRDSIMRIARDLGHEVREQELPREMLYVADEAFFCGTAAELTPIRSVDQVVLGNGTPGPITVAIQQQFMGIATGQLEDRYGWLTLVPEAMAAASGADGASRTSTAYPAAHSPAR
ncbi:MAG TPA: branched-chain amino acid transaminase [Gemmatimonadaceae bacterium]|nr:branched-chain amino acid transaminase [Gemmatimonadaceae bacterium]